MFRMTKDPKFLQEAQAIHAQAGPLYHNPVIGWSNPLQVCYCSAIIGNIPGRSVH